MLVSVASEDLVPVEATYCRLEALAPPAEVASSPPEGVLLPPFACCMGRGQNARTILRNKCHAIVVYMRTAVTGPPLWSRFAASSSSLCLRQWGPLGGLTCHGYYSASGCCARFYLHFHYWPLVFGIVLRKASSRSPHASARSRSFRLLPTSPSSYSKR